MTLTISQISSRAVMPVIVHAIRSMTISTIALYDHKMLMPTTPQIFSDCGNVHHINAKHFSWVELLSLAESSVPRDSK